MKEGTTCTCNLQLQYQWHRQGGACEKIKSEQKLRGGGGNDFVSVKLIYISYSDESIAAVVKSIKMMHYSI